MPSPLTWRNLVPGIIALAVVAGIALGVLLFAGIGRVRGPTMRLYVVTNQARGVMHGTEVWLAGQKIGVVDGVSFRPPASDTTARVVIEMTVRKRDAEQIRRDSRAEIRAGLNIIGPVVVSLTPGTPSVSRVTGGDTLRSGAQSDIEVAMSRLKTVARDLDPMMADARTIVRNVRNPDGTVGALLAGGVRGRSDVAELRARVSSLRATAFGAGAASRARTQLFARAHLALARSDSLRALLASPNGSLGRFRRDSTLVVTIAAIRDDLGAVLAAMDSADGTIARLQRDSALARSVAAAQREMRALFADVRRRPMPYIHFF